MTNAAPSPAAALPPGASAPPRTVIRPPGGWPVPDLTELWRYRDLLALLVTRNIAARYRQSVLGIGWALVKPIVTVTIYTIIFGNAIGIRERLETDVPYALFAFCGLIPWTFFGAALSGTTESVVGGQGLLTKVYFPRIVLPLSNLGTACVDLLIQLVLLAVILAIYGYLPGLEALLVPVFLLFAAAAALAGGLWLTALNVKYRDVRYAVPFLIQAGLYLSPVIYPPRLIPPDWRFLYYLNPMAGSIEGMRWCVLGTEPPQWGLVAVSAAATAALLAGGAMYFTRTERTFADII